MPDTRANATRGTAAPAAAVAILAAAVAAAGCSDDPLGPEEDAFRAARATWQASGLSAYEFDYRLQCFCGPPAIRPVTIEVQGGAVTAVRFRDEEGGEATEQERALFPTIDELFERIERTLEQNPVQFLAEYDEELGYPTFVSADIALNIADEEFVFRVTRLEPAALP